MNLFFYGTLLAPTTLAEKSGDPLLPRACRPARLTGWRRVRLAGTPYPTLRRAPGGQVDGAYAPVNAAALRRLKAYEGAAYTLQRVVVRSAARRIPAWTFIAPGGTHEPWHLTKEFP